MSTIRVVTMLMVCAGSALAADRVATAKRERADDVKALWVDAGLKKPPAELYLRAFKHERQLEVWGGPKGAALTLLKTYPFCAASGELGPKRKEGDLQVPEGFYEVAEFNPASNFHLSMKVSYPNASDAVLSDKVRPGGLIYLHGGCASIGCIAITDPAIEEVYLLASAAGRPIHFDIFPRRLDAPSVEALTDAEPNADFWRQLAPGYLEFEKTHRPPKARIDQKTGSYRVSAGR